MNAASLDPPQPDEVLHSGTELWNSIWVGAAANVVAAITIGIVVFIFRSAIAKWLRYFFPGVESKRPHVSFETRVTELDEGTWKTNVAISNAGDEPAYNVYVFMVERFPAGEFSVRSLGAQGVRRSVLGIRDSLEFEGLNMTWQGCNAMVQEWLWIEFENSSGVAFRTVVRAASARGDEERTEPTRVIRRRLEQIPGEEYRGSYEEWRRFRRGRQGFFPDQGRIERLRWRLAILLRYGTSEVIIREEEPGKLREHLADWVQPGRR